jgi:MFS family permease
MDGFAMVRSFDEAGYFESRVILMILALAISLFFAFKKEDNNYIVIFISSTIFFGIVELILFSLGMRAEGWTVSVFGLIIPTYLIWLFQGLGEGAIYGVSGFLFLDMYLKRDDESEFKLRRNLFLITMGIVFICAIIIGILARNKPITSVRPMFGVVAIIYLSLVIIISLVLAKFLCGQGFFKYLGYYLLGSFIFIVVNLEPMHILGARYIGVEQADGKVIYAEPIYQVIIMLYSYIVEITVPRAHYLVVPVVLGLIKLE